MGSRTTTSGELRRRGGTWIGYGTGSIGKEIAISYLVSYTMLSSIERAVPQCALNPGGGSIAYMRNVDFLSFSHILCSHIDGHARDKSGIMSTGICTHVR